MLSVTAQNVRLAQLDRAFGYGPKGREFESSNARIKRCKHCLQRFLLRLHISNDALLYFFERYFYSLSLIPYGIVETKMGGRML